MSLGVQVPLSLPIFVLVANDTTGGITLVKILTLEGRNIILNPYAIAIVYGMISNIWEMIYKGVCKTLVVK